MTGNLSFPSQREVSWGLRIFHQPLKSFGGVGPAGRGPGGEFGYVHPPVGDLAVVHPALGLFQGRSELPLGQACLFPHGAKERRQLSVHGAVLGLWRHGQQDTVFTILTQFPCHAILDTILMSCEGAFTPRPTLRLP